MYQRERVQIQLCYIGPLYAIDRCGSIGLRARRCGRLLSLLLARPAPLSARLLLSLRQ